jgi:SAM-dependent methyltransferase
MNRWKEIWDNRTIVDAGSTLEKLLAADGYDSAFGHMDIDAFMSFIDTLRTELDIRRNDSIFEVGCGAGAVLYPFYRQGHVVAGLDYSTPLTALAAQVMPGMNFSVKAADQTDTEQKFDIVLSCGVFIYFDSYSYAATVIAKMIQKAVKSVGIFDISDLALKSEAEQFRRSGLGTEAYAETYRGLAHLYYPKAFFHHIAETCGCRHHIFPQAIPGYQNSPYRYNVVFSKQSG